MIEFLLVAIVVVSALVIWSNVRRKQQKRERELKRIRTELAKDQKGDH